MQNEERNPEYSAPPVAGPRAIPASQLNLSPAAAVRFAAGLVLAAIALSLLWQAGLLPATRAGREPLPGGEARPVGQASPGGAPEQAAAGPAEGGRAENLAPPGGRFNEENIAPPAPGLLMSPPPTLDTVSYTGNQLGPKALELIKLIAESR